MGRALEGEAAADGIITSRSLAAFVRRQIRLLAQGVQNAHEIIWPTPVTDVTGVTRELQLFVLPSSLPPPGAGTTPPLPVRPVRLRIVGRSAAEAERLIRTLRNAELAGSGDAETLGWDAGRRLVLNDQGHRIADEVGEGDLQHVIDCRLALDRVIEMAANGLDVQVLLGGQGGFDTPASNATLKPGDRVTIKIAGLAGTAYLVVFNLTGKGEVQVLDPTPYRESNPTVADFRGPRFNTGQSSFGGEHTLPAIRVGEPFGADHAIAVAGARPLTRLMPALVAAHNRQDLQAVMAALASERAAQPLKLGLRGVFTWRT
jgi:hypothetical protein